MEAESSHEQEDTTGGETKPNTQTPRSVAAASGAFSQPTDGQAQAVSKGSSVLSAVASTEDLITALEALIALPTVDCSQTEPDSKISTACNDIERVLYSVKSRAPVSLQALEPILYRALVHHRKNMDAHLTCLEVLRKLCDFGSINEMFLTQVTGVLRNAKTHAAHKIGALYALGALCTCNAAHRTALFLQAENVRAISRTMRAFEQLPSAQGAAISAMFSRTGDITRAQAVMVVNCGVARNLVRALRVHGKRAELVEAALSAVAGLCRVCPVNTRETLRDAGVGRCAVDALVVHERDLPVSLAAVTLFHSLGPSVLGDSGGTIPRATLSAMCAFRSERQLHLTGLQVLTTIASNDTDKGDTGKQVAGSGAAQVVLTTMIEYRSDGEMQLRCVELLCLLIAEVGKDNLECNKNDLRTTVSASVKLYLMDKQFTEAVAKLLRLMKK